MKKKLWNIHPNTCLTRAVWNAGALRRSGNTHVKVKYTKTYTHDELTLINVQFSTYAYTRHASLGFNLSQRVASQCASRVCPCWPQSKAHLLPGVLNYRTFKLIHLILITKLYFIKLHRRECFLSFSENYEIFKSLCQCSCKIRFYQLSVQEHTLWRAQSRPVTRSCSEKIPGPC